MTVQIVHLSNLPTLLIDIAAWGIIHAGTGYLAHRIPAERLVQETWLTKPRRIERQGQLYEQLRIRSWKDRLPEAGDVFEGGVSKRHLAGRDHQQLVAFAVETRRAEIGHWLAAISSPVFLLWNRWPIAIVMMVYGFGVNAPFIAIQRYNRLRIARVLARWPLTLIRNERGTTGNNIP